MILGQDPLYAGDVWDALPVTLLKAVAAFAFLLVAVMLNIWFLRKVISDFQNRVGPTIAGPWGILQTLADGIKLFFKEDLVPDNADRFAFKLAPYLSLVPAFLTCCDRAARWRFQRRRQTDGLVTIFGKDTFLQVADPPIGILLLPRDVLARHLRRDARRLGSGSKYPLLGSVRASAQMVSYEAALGLAWRPWYSSPARCRRTTSCCRRGRVRRAGTILTTGIVPFVIFLIAGTAELNRPPFDLVEAEQELVGGFHTEYSSIRFALFFLAEFMNQITMSAIIVTLFLGGPQGPIALPPRRLVGRHHLVLPEAARLPVRVRLDPGHAAPFPLRPAHGSRVEVPHPAVARSGSSCSRVCAVRRRERLEPSADCVGGRRLVHGAAFMAACCRGGESGAR